MILVFDSFLTSELSKGRRKLPIPGWVVGASVDSHTINMIAQKT